MMRHLMQAPGKAPFEMVFPSRWIRSNVAPVNDGGAKHALNPLARALAMVGPVLPDWTQHAQHFFCADS
jgi:hypothetical protein